MPDHPRSAEEIARLKKNATAMALAFAVVMSIMKVAAWAATGSVSVLGALMDSILDNAVGIVNFVAVRQALRPADRFHRFGFGKFEPLASLAESAFMIGVSVTILFQAVDRFVHPVSVSHAEWGMGVMIGVIILLLCLITYQQHVIRRTGSLVVRADALHYKGDVMLHLSVAVSLWLSGTWGITWADPVFALGIVVYLLWSAKGIGAEALGILLDHELPDVERHRIREIVLSHPEVLNVHDLRTRTSGARKFIQLHVEMAPEITLRAAHRFAEEAIDLILQAFPNAEVQVHQEPLGEPRHRSWCREAGVQAPDGPGAYGGWTSSGEDSDNDGK